MKAIWAAQHITRMRPPRDMSDAAANTWWDGLTPDRRAQIHRWVDPPAKEETVLPGQLELIEKGHPDDPSDDE